MAEPLVGLLWRGELAQEIRAAAGEFDFLEVTAEHFLGVNARRAREADRIGARWPVLVHGLDLSLGTAAEPDVREAEERAALARRLGAAAFSEHVSFTKAAGRAIGQLTPVPFCGAAVEAMARRASALQERLACPLRLENVAYTFRPPGDEMPEAHFLSAVLRRTGAEMLLDLNNLHANATNFGYDAFAFLDGIPMDRVTEIHLAGGVWSGGLFLDTHSTAPGAEVWALLEEVAGRAPLRHVALEWDKDFPPFGEIVAVVRRARKVVRRAACAA